MDDVYYKNFDEPSSYRSSYGRSTHRDGPRRGGFEPYRSSKYNSLSRDLDERYPPKEYFRDDRSRGYSRDSHGYDRNERSYSGERRDYSRDDRGYSRDNRGYSRGSRNYRDGYSNTYDRYDGYSHESPDEGDEPYDINASYTSSGYVSRDFSDEKELFSRPNTGINFDKYDDIKIDVVGSNVPRPIERFEESNLHPSILENLKRSKFERPTPVQKYSIPILSSGRDLMASAQTGSGKTGGFLFPIINHLLSSKDTESTFYHGKAYPRAVILAPTRELVLQILADAQKFTYRTPIRASCVYGGTPLPSQARDLQKGCHILIGAAGRLRDMAQRGIISFSKVEFLCLDEADRMLDMGFEPQIRDIVEGRDMPPVGKRRTMMFSATFPKEIQQLATDFLVPDYLFLKVGEVGSTSENITQIIKFVEDHEKDDALIKELQNFPEKTLIFAETKKKVDALSRMLGYNKFRVSAIHGDRKQSDREIALHRFRTGKSNILIATSVAARGLDIEQVAHVINYDLPGNIDDYVHRIGRTGRVGNTGIATAFYNEKNANIAKDLLKRLKESNQEIPDWLYDQIKKGQKSNSYGGYRGYGNRGYGNRGYGGSRGFGGKRGGGWEDGIVGMPDNTW